MSSFDLIRQMDARGATINYVAGNQQNVYLKDLATDNDTILQKLKPVDREHYYITQCIDGTRLEIFEQVKLWLRNDDGNNILWISGSPGAGKSAIGEQTTFAILLSHSRQVTSRTLSIKFGIESQGARTAWLRLLFQEGRCYPKQSCIALAHSCLRFSAISFWVCRHPSQYLERQESRPSEIGYHHPLRVSRAEASFKLR